MRYAYMNRKRSEATEQERVVNYCRYNEMRYPELKLLHHIPNGGRRDKKEAARLKAQGGKAGVPDLFLPVPRQGFHGLYIEMKYGENKTTQSQRFWLEELKKQGFKTIVCYGADAAIKEIDEYMSIEKIGV